jgi:predicted glycosyl hydrolase (DUF1957 family)
MLCLALVLELHHPLPGPGEFAGADWAAEAIESAWPALRAVSSFAAKEHGGSLTLAVSPGWMALAADPTARSRVIAELERHVREQPEDAALRQFILDQWHADAIALVRELSRSGAVDVIPMTSSHAWLPSVAQDPTVARAQVGLAAADHARRLGLTPSGMWLPFLSYLPGLEAALGESRLRYFGVTADAFLRGTVLPPDQFYSPMVTPSGVASFGVSPEPTRPIVDPHTRYGRDPRYHNPAQARQAATEHARHFLDQWHGLGMSAPAGMAEPICVAAMAVHDLGWAWPRGNGALWLEQVLEGLAGMESVTPTSLGAYLDRHPTGVMGRPGPSAGGFLAARPAGSDLFDRCRAAADVLTFALERRRSLDGLERRSVAHMTRLLLRAQQVDWSLPPGRGVGAEMGLKRADAYLRRFHELAGLLLAGRPDRRLLDRLDRGPAYLPEIDLDLLAAS